MKVDKTAETPTTEAISLPEIVNPESLDVGLPQMSGETLSDVVPEPEAPIAPEDKPKRGRGRPAGSKGGGKTTAVKSKSAAELTCVGLDMVRHIISDGTCEPDPSGRKATHEALTAYYLETGKEPPASLLALMASAGYVAPSLATPPAASKFEGFKAKVGAWWLNRKAAKAAKK